jgi:hypothetical protein
MCKSGGQPRLLEQLDEPCVGAQRIPHRPGTQIPKRGRGSRGPSRARRACGRGRPDRVVHRSDINPRRWVPLLQLREDCEGLLPLAGSGVDIADGAQHDRYRATRESGCCVPRGARLGHHPLPGIQRCERCERVVWSRPVLIPQSRPPNPYGRSKQCFDEWVFGEERCGVAVSPAGAEWEQIEHTGRVAIAVPVRHGGARRTATRGGIWRTVQGGCESPFRLII